MLYCCSFMRVMLRMSHRANCARLYVKHASSLHCVSASWSMRVAVLLVHLLPGWLAVCSTAADVHYSRRAWAGSLCRYTCYHFPVVDLQSGLVWGWAQVGGFDPGAQQSVARAPVSSPCDAVHVTLIEKGCNTQGLLCVSGTRHGNAYFCQIVQNGDGVDTKSECACMDLICQYVLVCTQTVQLRLVRWQHLHPAAILPRVNHPGYDSAILYNFPLDAGLQAASVQLLVSYLPDTRLLPTHWLLRSSVAAVVNPSPAAAWYCYKIVERLHILGRAINYSQYRETTSHSCWLLVLEFMQALEVPTSSSSDPRLTGLQELYQLQGTGSAPQQLSLMQH